MNGKVLEASDTEKGEEMAHDHMVIAQGCPDGEVRPEEEPSSPGKNPPPTPLDAEPADRHTGMACGCWGQQCASREQAGQTWLLCCRQSLPISYLYSFLLKESHGWF